MNNSCHFKYKLSISWYAVGIVSFIPFQQCSQPGDSSLRDTDLRIVIKTEYYILDIEKAGFRYGFRKTDGGYSFEVILENRSKIILRIYLNKETAHFELENPENEAIAMALRTAGVSPGYGQGDVLTYWWQRLPENKEKFQTEITGFVNCNYYSSNSYDARMVSNFAIYPIKDKSDGSQITYLRVRHAFEFDLIPGHDFVIN